MCGTLDAARDYYTKRSKSEGERPTLYDITYIWSLKYDTNKPTYEIETDPQTHRTVLWLPRVGRLGEGRKDWEQGITRCKLVEWMSYKVLQYSTGTIFNRHFGLSHDKNIHI